MPIKKVGNWPTTCTHPDHNFPNMIVLPPGIYEHTCPACGAKQTVHIPGTFCSTDGTRTATSGHVISDVNEKISERGKGYSSTAC